MVSIVFHFLIFQWLIQVTLTFLTTIDNSYRISLNISVYVGKKFTSFFIFIGGPPLSFRFYSHGVLFTLFIRFSYVLGGD